MDDDERVITALGYPIPLNQSISAILYSKSYDHGSVSTHHTIGYSQTIAMIFIQCIAMSMAELCSAMPTRYDTLPDVTPEKLVFREEG
jgi:hypothetical protein